MKIKNINLLPILLFLVLFLYNDPKKKLNIGVSNAISYTTRGGVHRFSANFKLDLKKHYFSEIKQNKSTMLFKFRPKLSLTPGNYAEIIIEPQFTRKFKLKRIKKKIESKRIKKLKKKKKKNKKQGFKNINKLIPMSINQAYILIKPTNFILLSLGRQPIFYDNPLFIGSQNFNKINNSFDTFKIRIKYGVKNWIDFFICSLASKTQLFKGNIYLTGLYNQIILGKYINIFNFHIATRFSSLKNTKPIFSTGIKIKTKINNIDYKFLISGQLEKGKISTEYNLELGYTISKILNKPRISILIFGNTENYKKLYPNINKWIGYINTFSKKNMKGLSIQINSKINNWFKTKIDLVYMVRNFKPKDIEKINNNILLFNKKNKKRTIASELNITTYFDINKNLSINAGMNIVKPRNDLKTKVGNYKIPILWFTQINTKM